MEIQYISNMVSPFKGRYNIFVILYLQFLGDTISFNNSKSIILEIQYNLAIATPVYHRFNTILLL